MDQSCSAQTPPITQSTPVPIIGVEYCASADPLQLVMVKEILHISDGNFEVTDSVDNVVFNVKGKIATLRGRRVLYDAAGNPIVTIRKKMCKMETTGSIFLNKNKYSVTVNPNMDSAFIVSLIALLDDIN
uniref:Tubby C-terminal domain-containing protein n=1 Tax=Fagus sylvatica TaxID=28930 RepID=A0A2N9HK92_FAGSY